MEKQMINGVAIYNFPNNIDHMLYWMGDNYIETIIDTFTDGFKKQDPLTQLLAIMCKKEPEFETSIADNSNQIKGMKAIFTFQILLKDGANKDWRLYGKGIFTGTNLNTNEPEINFDFDLEKTEDA